MKYISKVRVEELRDKYTYLVGWAPSEVEFVKRYTPLHYKLDYMIDGKGTLVGKTICGINISDISILQKLSNEKICIIIYFNLETEILEQVQKYAPWADTIISRLLITDSKQTYSTDYEDRLMLELSAKLNLKDFSYMDIGACHPLIRNNTFLFYESGFKNGVIVEPNPDMCKLFAEYRPENRIFQCGVCAGESSVGTYYAFHNMPGLNTFVGEKAAGISQSREPHKLAIDIPLININDMIGKTFDTYPDVLDIDCEGMDLEILRALDTAKYPIKIICAERPGDKELFREILFKKGYIHYTSTRENDIFLRVEYFRNHFW